MKVDSKPIGKKLKDGQDQDEEVVILEEEIVQVN